MIDRRKFLSYVPTAAALGGVLVAGSANASGKDSISIGAIETLSRGHGLLGRAMIIYDVIRERLGKGHSIEPESILKTADVFHSYLEEFHEKTEEKYVFASMEKAKLCFDSIQELKVQHGTGFELNKRISSLAKDGKLGPELAGYLGDFNSMYRHHMAWEDTVIFPAFDDLEGSKNITSLAAEVAADEKKILGGSGFESFVKQLADVEKRLGIFELSGSTAKL